MEDAARLLDVSERYVALAVYDIMLGDCLRRLYRTVGKFSPRIYAPLVASSYCPEIVRSLYQYPHEVAC